MVQQGFKPDELWQEIDASTVDTPIVVPPPVNPYHPEQTPVTTEQPVQFINAKERIARHQEQSVKNRDSAAEL